MVYNTLMKLFYGLGNPGKTYENNRHNLGQIIIKKITPNLTNSSKLNCLLSKEKNNIFAISTEYMNNSGISVSKIAKYYKIDPSNIYIIHDDLDIEVGDWKIQFDRGSAGHNGIKSIIENLGTQAFNRIRVGIGKPTNNIPIEDYVLQNFTPDQKKIILPAIDQLIPELNKIIEQ